MPNSGLHLILILTLENSVFLQPGLVILQISQYLPEVPCCSSNRDRSLRSSKWSGSPGCAGNTEGTSQLCFLDEESRNKYFFVLYVSIKKKKKEQKKERERNCSLPWLFIISRILNVSWLSNISNFFQLPFFQHWELSKLFRCTWEAVPACTSPLLQNHSEKDINCTVTPRKLRCENPRCSASPALAILPSSCQQVRQRRSKPVMPVTFT